MILVTLTTSFIVIISSKCDVTELPRFRILAPQLVCPKDDNSPIEKPNNTVITIQTIGDEDLRLDWTVRWHPLAAPSQRFTLLLWRKVRALEAKLNGLQPEPLTYVINDDELLNGVNYIFNVTAVAPNTHTVEPKSFYINNTFGQRKLEAVDGLTDMLSMVVVGGQIAFVDVEYILEAVVYTCVPFQDFHFTWVVQNVEFKLSLNISTESSRLEIPPYSVQPGIFYDVTCFVIKDSNEEIITQMELPFQVGFRGLEVSLGVDALIVGIDEGFTVESVVINHDYFNVPVKFQWQCSFRGAACKYFEDPGVNNLNVLLGLPTPGQYDFTVTVGVLQQTAEAKVTITAVERPSPIVQIAPIARVLNEGATLALIANASNLTPTCTLQWYFVTEDRLNDTDNDSTNGGQHGTPITDLITIFSLDENFLYELTDFSNDTEWREVTAELEASAGRARFVVECNCSLAVDCTTEGSVYADIHFTLNKRPTVSDVTVFPTSGTALETVFRVSTGPATDLDGPLRYTFYCDVGNNVTLVLGSYLEHLTVETFLPYLGDGTAVWVHVCDVRGACSQSVPKVVQLLKGESRSLDILMSDIRAHIRRCEVSATQRAAVAAVVTYTNAGRTEALTVFTRFLLDSLPTLAQRCVSQNSEKYLEFLAKLSLFGLDTSELK